MFGKKVIDEGGKKSTIPYECIVCELLKKEKNKHGTVVVSSAKLYTYDENYLKIEGNESKFIITDVHWNGKSVKHYTSQEANSITEGKSKRTGRVLGAVIGTAIAPGIGTVIGAAHGTGNSKSNETTNTRYNIRNTEEEIPSSLKMNIKYEEGSSDIIFYEIYEAEAHKLLSFFANYSDKDLSCLNNEDVFVSIKKIKELLDIGAITQDEFDTKKKELLEKI